MSDKIICDPLTCDKQCKDHSAQIATVNRHEIEITKLFEKTDDLETRTATLEGKFTVYSYLSLGFLSILCIIAFYSYLQLMDFKSEYRKDMKTLTQTNNMALRDTIKADHSLDLRLYRVETKLGLEEVNEYISPNRGSKPNNN